MKNKEDNCMGCRYVTASPSPNSADYVCVCEASPHYKEVMCRSSCGPGCGCYDTDHHKDMSLLEAMKTLLCIIGYPGYPSFYHKLDEDDIPCFMLTFETNEELENYRDAHCRLFEEAMRLMKEKGEFEEESA